MNRPQMGKATAWVREWILSIFLPRIIKITNIRILLATRNIVDPSPSYEVLMTTRRLGRIINNPEYSQYCQDIGIHLPDNVIDAFARASGHIPGTFIDLLTAYKENNVNE